MTDDLDALVPRARDGDLAALGALLTAVRDDAYSLAMRMLGQREDAEDAAQEILIRITARLATFRGEAAFRTWAYRVAANHLLTAKARRPQPELSFDVFAADLADGLDRHYDAGDVDEGLLADEVRVGCSQAMLLCLDGDHRLAYILGEVFELPSGDAAFVCGVAPAAYRKRLSRARERVHRFVDANCGVANASNPCRCSRRVGTALARGRIDPKRLTPSIKPTSEVAQAVREMERLQAAATVLRSHPRYQAPDRLVAEVARLVATGALGSLGSDELPM